MKNFRNFVAWAEPDPKLAFFAFLRYPSTVLCTAYRKQFCPQTNGTDGKLRVWRCAFCYFASLERLWPAIWPKSGHMTIMKIENLHIVTRRKIHWFQKCYSFRQRKITKLSRKNHFRTVASPGAWPSWIDTRRQYVLLVVIVIGDDLLLLLLLMMIWLELCVCYSSSCHHHLHHPHHL